MASKENKGINTIPSHYSVDETVARLQSTLQSKGIKVFALIDHSGEARAAGLMMPPTKVVIFGNPRAGTPLMLAAPSVAIDLPLKALVREDAHGQVFVSWNSAEYLQARHHLPEELAQKSIGGAIDQLMANVADQQR